MKTTKQGKVYLKKSAGLKGSLLEIVYYWGFHLDDQIE